MTNTRSDQDDTRLAAQIVEAVKEYDAADATRKEKAIAAGTLLAEAHKRHPTQKDFEKFLELAGGIGIRRAETFIAIAVGRKDFEQHQAENAAAAQRHRDKLKAEKIEREKAKAALPKPEPKSKGKGKSALRNADEKSAAHFRQFKLACETYLPLLNRSDLEKAGKLFQRYWDMAQLQNNNKKAA